MKKGIGKNILRVVLASIALSFIMTIAKETKLLESLGDIVGKITLNAEKVVSIILAIIIVVLISNILLVILGLFSKLKGTFGTISGLGSSLVKYASGVFLFCWIMRIIGVDVSTIFAGVGIFALIIGFGAESLVADLVTGLFIVGERQYDIGDVIEVDGFRGVVKEIRVRVVTIEDVGGNIKIINNSELRNIVNRSKNKSIAVCDVCVSYSVDMEEFEKKIPKILDEIKTNNQDVFTGKVAYEGVEQLTENAVYVRIVAEVSEECIYVARRVLNKEIKKAFDKAGIVMYCPDNN